MDQPDAIVRLLEEIRDQQGEHLAEYRRISQQILEMNQAAAEASAAYSQQSIEASRSFVRALYILIALCLGANLWMLVRLSSMK